MPLPMLAEFAVELAGGSAALLLILPWRAVPVRFFRTHCQVILGLFVLATMALAGAGGARGVLALMIGAAVLSYLATVAWGLGLPRLALPLTAWIVVAALGLLVETSRGPTWSVLVLGAATRIAAGVFLGSGLTAMLLGHHYLTAPAMAIDPLRRLVAWVGGSLTARALLAAVGLGLWVGGRLSAAPLGSDQALYLAVRWVVGIGAPAIATFLAWRTVAIRSTQSATGILYILFILTLFGELTAQTLSRSTGVLM
jgi:hypothetical protein